MAVLDIKTDLRHRLGPARDQGPRPTCLAFAASDLHAAVRPGWTPLSCEAAFHHAQMRAGRSPSSGAGLGFMLDALREDGQPAEEHWPYVPTPPANDAWSTPPVDGERFTRKGQALPFGWAEIVDALQSERPALILLRLSASFYRPDAAGVVHPAPGEVGDPALGHAVLAVGHGEIGGAPAILVRNSWGTGWGVAGHAWLTQNYVEPRLYGFALLEEDDYVSPHSAAA
ncbi:C1 family peptidase [Brevundimonas sp.]|uniref:C1 family peptidase n=1 Tax=Brevundimonas sp. TaxID=1871086 RepID=UPI00261DC706|nr:C1 family peptidase [Brevundimonas sp.]